MGSTIPSSRSRPRRAPPTGSVAPRTSPTPSTRAALARRRWNSRATPTAADLRQRGARDGRGATTRPPARSPSSCSCRPSVHRWRRSRFAVSVEMPLDQYALEPVVGPRLTREQAHNDGGIHSASDGSAMPPAGWGLGPSARVAPSSTSGITADSWAP